MLSFTFTLPTTLVFGPGRLAELATTPLLPQGRQAMIVIGASGNILRQGYLARVQGLLSDHGVKSVVFDGVRTNPRTEDVDAAAAKARDMGVDFLVGLGGGSVIDSAKCIALAAATDGPFWDTMAARKYDGIKGLPLVAIPTTAGTGTEANSVAMLCGPEGKRGFMHPSFYPALALVDPELMRSMPPRLTAITGMDVFFHAVECFLSTARQPLSDMLCLEAAHLATRFLPAAVDNGDDLNARTAMAWASTAAGMSLSLSSPISQHALEYSFSGSNHESQHGAGLVLLCRPYFSRLIELAEGDDETSDRLLNLAVAMGFGAGGDEDEDGHPFLIALEALLEAVGLADMRAEDLGFFEESVPQFVEAAMKLTGMRHFVNTPVPMSEADVREIFEGVFARE
jgi:alcohol dehydrogenase